MSLISPSHPTQEKNAFINLGHNPDQAELLHLNAQLDELSLYEINETTINRLVHKLEATKATDQPAYWLMMVRLFELTLVCAGHYADNCEFSAAGDLLFNPRELLIYRKNSSQAILKNRHGRLSDQLNKGHHDCKSFFLWFQKEVTLEIAEPALLEYLYAQLQQSRKIAVWYLKDGQDRMTKIATTICFLAAWPVAQFEEYHHRMKAAPPSTHRFVAAHLCRFDTSIFDRLGSDIVRLTANGPHLSDFLIHEA